MATHDGGKPNVKPLPYSPPQGPSDQMRARPGLGGEVYPCGTQDMGGRPSESGSPGLHGDNRGNKGTQR